MMSVSICMHVWMRLMLFLALNCSYPHHVMFKTCILKKVEVTVTSFIVEIKNYRRLSEWEDTKQSIINFWLNHRMMANIIFLFTGVAKILDKSIQYRHSFSSFHSLPFSIMMNCFIAFKKIYEQQFLIWIFRLKFRFR